MRNEYWVEGDTAYVICNNKKGEISGFFSIDREDIAILPDRKFYIGVEQYPNVKLGQKTLTLHRILMPREDKPKKLVVDHINRNRLDNRKCNLRWVDRSLNSLNRSCTGSSSSGFKNVYYSKGYGKYESRFVYKGETHHFGCYDTAEEAHEAKEKALQGLLQN